MMRESDVPTKRKKASNIKANQAGITTAEASVSQTAKDDIEITALSLQRGKLSPAMEGYFGKCEEKLGFVPNVLSGLRLRQRQARAVRRRCTTT